MRYVQCVVHILYSKTFNLIAYHLLSFDRFYAEMTYSEHRIYIEHSIHYIMCDRLSLT